MKFETVYNFNVFDELKKGNEVYIIDKGEIYSTESIVKASCLKAGALINIIECQNNDNKYEFYKIVETEE